jgi:hypothetical protein
LGLARRSTLICCLSIKISASSIARERSRSIIVPTISLHKSNIEQQHRPILDQLPAIGFAIGTGFPYRSFEISMGKEHKPDVSFP